MFDEIAERKIAEAMERGEFQDLPGTGQPLDLTDDALIPEDLRVAYRIPWRWATPRQSRSSRC